MATLEQLLTILKRLAASHSEVTWKLLLDLFPKHHSSISDSYKPSPWRSWIAGWTGEVSNADYVLYVSGLVDLAIDMASEDGSRWSVLLENCTSLPPTERRHIYSALERLEPEKLEDKSRQQLWGTLRETVAKHSAFREANWVLPSEEVQRLTVVRDQFAPEDAIESVVHLFGEGELFYESADVPYDEREHRLRRKQQEAVERVWNSDGFPGVLTLAQLVRESWLVGIALAPPRNTSGAVVECNSVVAVRDRSCHY